jgi:hypothetical protein
VADEELFEFPHTTLAREGRLAEAFEAFIKRNGGGVAFVELENAFGEIADLKGHLAIYVGDKVNLLIWAGMSQVFVDALNELRERHTTTLGPTSILTYFADGKVLTFPLAKSARDYKTEHWAPCVLNMKKAS